MFKVKTVSIVFISMLVFICSGCSNSSNKNKSIKDLVQNFKSAGFVGSYREKSAILIGAAEGGLYEGAGFSVEIYRFGDSSKAKSLEATDNDNLPTFVNGNFIMMVYKGKEKILPVFNKF